MQITCPTVKEPDFKQFFRDQSFCIPIDLKLYMILYSKPPHITHKELGIHRSHAGYIEVSYFHDQTLF